MNNPFSYVKNGVVPVEGERFVGRQRQIEDLLKRIGEPLERRRHLAIHGLPHIGKSSLLLTLQRRLEADPAFVPLSAEVPSDDGMTCHSLFYEILTSACPDYFGIDDEEALAPLLELLRANAASGKRTVLLLDEFERIHTWEQADFDVFLSVINDKELNVTCVTASRPRITAVLKSMELYPDINPFVPILLTGFDDREMDDFFKLLPTEATPTDKAFQALLRICGRNPYLLTWMGCQLCDNDKEYPLRAMADHSFRGTVEVYFDDVIRFIHEEEKKKLRSLSHIVKCYFGQYDDYQDIKERCVALGYLELACKDSPYSYQEVQYDFNGAYDMFDVYDRTGRALTEAEKRRRGLCYTTVSPVFTEYLFSIHQGAIVPLEKIQDAGDLLTGVIHAMRDITRREFSRCHPGYNQGVEAWNAALVSHFTTNDRQFLCEIPFSNRRWQQWENGGRNRVWPDWSPPTRAEIHAATTAYNGRQGPVVTLSCPLSFVNTELNNGHNRIDPSIAAINLNDQYAIFKAFWRSTSAHPVDFSRYFGAITLGDLKRDVQTLKDHRDRMAHFSRHSTASNGTDIRPICRKLLKTMYYYIYSGTALTAVT